MSLTYLSSSANTQKKKKKTAKKKKRCVTNLKDRSFLTLVRTLSRKRDQYLNTKAAMRILRIRHLNKRKKHERKKKVKGDKHY